MKQNFFILILGMFCTVSAWSQADTVFVLPAEITADTVTSDTTFRIAVTHAADQLGNAYLPTQIKAGYRLLDGFGRLYRIDSVLAADFTSTLLDVTELQDGLAPSGAGVVYRKQTYSNCIPVVPMANSNVAPSTLARIFNHNAVNGCVDISTFSSLVDSTRLLQDSILVYFQDGLEVGRDTISGLGGTTYTAGYGIDIAGNTIEADTSELATQSDLPSILVGDGEVAYGDGGGGLLSSNDIKIANNRLLTYNNHPTVDTGSVYLIGGTSINALSNRNIAAIDFQSRDGFPAGKTVARIQGYGYGTHSASANPSGLRFLVTPTTTLVEGASLDNSGNWSVLGNGTFGGNGDFGGTFSASGNATFGGDISVAGAWTGSLELQETTSTTDADGVIRIWSKGSLNAISGIDHVGSIDFFSSDDGGSSADFIGPKVASIEAYAGDTHNASGNSTGLRFKITDGTDYNTAVTLAHNGRLGVSTPTPSYLLSIGDATADNAAIRLFPHANALTTTSGVIYAHTNDGWKMSSADGSEMLRPALYEDAAPDDGDILVYNAANSRYENENPQARSYTPTSTGDANGDEGDIAYDDDYIYVKTSAGWKRAALSTF